MKWHNYRYIHLVTHSASLVSRGAVAQSVAQRILTPLVLGSSPSGAFLFSLTVSRWNGYSFQVDECGCGKGNKLGKDDSLFVVRVLLLVAGRLGHISVPISMVNHMLCKRERPRFLMNGHM